MSPRREILSGEGPVEDRRSEASNPFALPSEIASEAAIRPRALDEFIGQTQIKGHLEVVIKAAQGRGQSVDHLLFAGPPGLGKTSLAQIVANEMGAGFRVTSGPTLVRGGDLAAILNSL
nr:AAA family ATPase [Actinomycetota bacterium]